MNYLGHAYLSFNHPAILVGNMISDFVKGKKQYDYPPDIQKGIRLHRELDRFTDLHAATISAKKIFHPHYRLYSGAIVDVIYDHFIANHEESFNEQSLISFTADVYHMLELHAGHLPPHFARMFTYMRAENWLLNYRKQSGTQRSLQGLIRRSAYLTESETAFQLFLSHYEELRHYSSSFIADVKSFAKDRYETLLL